MNKEKSLSLQSRHHWDGYANIQSLLSLKSLKWWNKYSKHDVVLCVSPMRPFVYIYICHVFFAEKCRWTIFHSYLKSTLNFFLFFLSVFFVSHFYQRDCFLSYSVISLILTGEILHLYDLRDLQNCLFPAGCRDGVRDESFHFRRFSSIRHSICSLEVEIHLMSLWNDYCKSLLRLPVEQLK